MLRKKLEEYNKSDMYPFHMPGHKRNLKAFPDPVSIDITEIEGFDNLHHPEGIILEEENKAAKIYGTVKTFFLVNGSTCGLLTAVSSVAGENDKLLVSRNSHQSVYHALVLRKINPVYIWPKITGYGIQGVMPYEEVKQAIEENPDAKGIVITSPTYEGVVSDIKKIGDLAHENNMVLIVDEAHGAHFNFGEDFPKSAVDLGADLVVQSLHKTLSALTQTACLHLCSERISEEKIRKFLDIYQTSSPSYVFMSSITDCIEDMKNGQKSFHDYKRMLDDFYDAVKGTKKLHVMQKGDFSADECFDLDASKIVIDTKNASFGGAKLNRLLHDKYHIELEMVAPDYVLAMTSVCDTKEGFDRLRKAILEIDDEALESDDNTESRQLRVEDVYKPLKRAASLHEIFDKEVKCVPFDEAVGKVNADFIYLYPPDVPIIVPGEEITKEFIETLRMLIRENMSVKGLPVGTDEFIYIAVF